MNELINKVHQENCLATMSRMPDGFIDLVVTSPPYDNLRDYEGYDFDFESIAKELYRVVKPGGVVVWIVGDATIDGSETGTSFKQALYFKEIGFNLHDTMIYQQTGTGAKGSNFAYWQEFEYMFVFSKGKPNAINRLTFKRSNNGGGERGGVGGKGKIRTRPKNDFSIRSNVWRMSGDGINVHPAPFPEKLAQDHIYSWSNEGDIVYDPMGGSGTTCKMAAKMKRKWLMSELSANYCAIAQKRIDVVINQYTLDI